MRFLIEPKHGKPVIIRGDCEDHSIGWIIAQDGIHGWYGTPEVREDPVKVDARDGDLPPSTKTQGAKIWSLDVIAPCNSEIEMTRITDRINGLVGQTLKITGTDAVGDRWLEGYLSDDPEPEYLPNTNGVLFTLTFTCPYPSKRGKEHIFPIVNGSCIVTNIGNKPAYPKIHVWGGLKTVTTAYTDATGEHVVSWHGPADEVTIDMFDLSCGAGKIVDNDAFAIPPGEHECRIVSEPAWMPAEVILAPAWR